jgi:nicotinate-nucleotide adenylyltransferase
VLFVPAGRPPHKQTDELSSSKDRAAMVRAAIEDNGAFELSRVDLDRPGPHYTVDTLALLQAQFPEVGKWFFLMGEDSLHDLPSWYDVEGILAQATLAVMPRSLALSSRSKRVDLDTLYERIPQLQAKPLIWLDVPPIDYSSTVLRNRAREGLPLRYLAPPKVVAYVHKHNLYNRQQTGNAD